MTRMISRQGFQHGIGRIARIALLTAIVAGLASLTVRSATWARGTIGTFVVSTVLAAQRPAFTATPVKPTVDAAIVKIADDFRKAVLAADARAVAAMYREDGVELPNCAPAAKGRTAIEQRYREFFSTPIRMAAFTFTHAEAVASGDLAYDVGSYEDTLSLPDGSTATDKGKYVAILRRSQGDWKLAHLIYNSDAPAAPSCSGH
jgi:uncharacterized protein (TIGR02246 family)